MVRMMHSVTCFSYILFLIFHHNKKGRRIEFECLKKNTHTHTQTWGKKGKKKQLTPQDWGARLWVSQTRTQMETQILDSGS